MGPRRLIVCLLAFTGVALFGCTNSEVDEDAMMEKQEQMAEGARNLPGMTEEQFQEEMGRN